MREREHAGDDWNERERQAYVEDRARLRNKLLTDRLVWDPSIQAVGAKASTVVTWIDGAGKSQQAAPRTRPRHDPPSPRG